MPLINCKINLQLKCSSICSTGAGTSRIIDTKLYVPVVTLSTQDNTKLLQQLKSGFKRTFNWNKYKSEPKSYDARTPYLDRLIDSSFQEVNRPFENSTNRTSHTEYYLQKVERKYCNIKVDGRNSFGKRINNDIKTHENIRKIATAHGDDYATGWLLDYPYFKENYKMIAIDLSKQQS